jgi:uncharacterized protein YecT (DUF1311 family)
MIVGLESCGSAGKLYWLGVFIRTGKFDALDKIMNDVYQAVRVVTPPDRFAEVKHEQIAWLKSRDGAGSVEEKSKLTESRIRTLQELLW